ncbi:DUF3630 family protein [Alteromonas lipolytica]|uniref:DUF3630 domain-containing protein n=1 Tax=Alteromonas lipolytica TaxID=1856405 RepID=A0A1E8FC12_9ALTE|nr:DUF3630 family protein [Alteromonas lipolytica]OFI33455.1 hypothetical protein BFC17_04130 [Alteromonas lipolytica]GGF59536.1 hypothetical protein GCM10011338_09740 [Alteromonas lipolytica]
MQQLTLTTIARNWVCEPNVIRWTGTMPATQQQAVGLCHNIAKVLNARQGESDWGADRLQVRLSADDFEVVLNVEWLCEAVWLEPVGASSALLSKSQMIQNVHQRLLQVLEEADL